MSRANLSKAIRQLTKALGPYQEDNVFIDVRVYRHKENAVEDGDWQIVLDNTVGNNRVRIGVKRKVQHESTP